MVCSMTSMTRASTSSCSIIALTLGCSRLIDRMTAVDGPAIRAGCDAWRRASMLLLMATETNGQQWAIEKFELGSIRRLVVGNCCYRRDALPLAQLAKGVPRVNRPPVLVLPIDLCSSGAL